MATRRQWHLSAVSAIAGAALLAACGGGGDDKELNVSRVIAFGDSLTDIGTYTPATSLTTTPGAAPYFGGKFTTNSFIEYTMPPAGVVRTANTSNANIWVEWVAARVGVAITPAEVGFGPTRVPCPAAASGLAATCSGYAQGGSRVTDPNGIGKTSGALTIPIVQQIASHNTRTVAGFGTGFGGGDIVFVFGGNNDVFVQAGMVAALVITPQQAAAAVAQAGTELATLVKNEILAKGATRVAVMTLPDSATTPYGSSLTQPGRDLLTQLSAAFNTALLTGLDGSAARIIDTRAIFAATLAAPPAGFNTTAPACSAAKIAVITGGLITDGSSLFCNASAGVAFNGITTGVDASKYFFADSVHPTTASHKIIADQVILAVKSFGWVPSNL